MCLKHGYAHKLQLLHDGEVFIDADPFTLQPAVETQNYVYLSEHELLYCTILGSGMITCAPYERPKIVVFSFNVAYNYVELKSTFQWHK